MANEMIDKWDDVELQRTRVMNALSETCLEVDDTTVELECELLGEVVELVASDVKALLLRAAQNYRKSRLQAAAEEYRQVTARIGKRWLDLPVTPVERRMLLANVFSAHPNMKNAMLTMQHREFKELSEQDVE